MLRLEGVPQNSSCLNTREGQMWTTGQSEIANCVILSPLLSLPLLPPLCVIEGLVVCFYTSFSSFWNDVRLRFSLTLMNSGARSFSCCSSSSCFSNFEKNNNRKTKQENWRSVSLSPEDSRTCPGSGVRVREIPPPASCVSSSAPPPEGSVYAEPLPPVSFV